MKLSDLSDKTIRTLYRIAKNSTKGARPFFVDPRAMVALREEPEKRSKGEGR